MKHLDLFSGYAGFTIPAQRLGIETIGFSEIDFYMERGKKKKNHAPALLRYRFPNIKNYGDITKINTDDLPDFDLLTGGFPCQSYSIAGKRGGLEDLRGQLIYDVFRILRAKKPKWFVLENVKGLLNHDSGKSAGLIFTLLRESGYAVDERVLNTKDFGLPQNRERVFIVGLREDLCGTLPDFWHFDFPIPPKTPCKLIDILESKVDEKYYLKPAMVKKLLQYNQRNKENRNGFEAKFHSVDGIMSALKVGGGGVNDLIQINNPKHSNNRIYSAQGLSPALYSMQGGNRQPKIAIKIPSATACGYEIANEEDGIRMAHIGSKTGRGRVGKQCAQTLTLAGDMYTIYNSQFRRLIPKECARLQGLSDDWLDFGIDDKGKEYRLSDSAKYKLAGNGVSIPVVEAIIQKIVMSI